MAPAETERSKASPGDKQTAAAADRSVLSPRFRSAAAMAGWDEEALLAGLIVEDTPVRDSKQRKRFSKTPSSGSKRKRSQRRSPSSVPMAILCLDDEGSTKEESTVPDEKNNGEVVEVPSTSVEVEPKADAEAVTVVESDKNQPATAVIPCMDRLREELSCAICLDICFEPSTTPCGHSFCRKCLKCAASKCGKRCPKCRDLIGNARSCTVNTVLWNTIQLLFPEEIEARRKKPSSPKPPTATKAPPPRLLAASRHSAVAASPNRSAFILSSELVSEAVIRRNRRRSVGGRVSPNQLEDAALALRLQREEFMGSVAERREPVLRRSSSIQSARDHLRALASRAVQVRTSSRFW